MTEAIDPTRQFIQYQERLDAAHANLRHQLTQVGANRRRIESAQEGVDRLLAEIAMQGYDQPALRALARQLYWQCPEVRVDAIGRLVGAKGNRVSEADRWIVPVGGDMSQAEPIGGPDW